MGIQISLKEHKYWAAYDPNFEFSKPSGSILRIASTTASIGAGYAFFVCPRQWLNGKYVRWRWGGYYSGTSEATIVGARIHDGALNRSSSVDFPSGSDIPNSVLQTLASEYFAGTLSRVTRDVLVNIAGTEQLCTVAFRIRDAWEAQSAYMDLDWVEINEASGGVGNIFREDFDGSVTMESTGGTADYGYIGQGQVIGWRRQIIIA